MTGLKYRNRYRINSARLRGHDYTRPGNYFITICTRNRGCLLGEIINKKMNLSPEGKIVAESWSDLTNHYGNIILDEFIIMPNHVHGIIKIINHPGMDTHHGISEFIRAFKSFSSRRINEYYLVETGLRPVSTGIWQPRYYDHIIRSQTELNIIRTYIKNNPDHYHNDHDYHGINPIK